MDGAKVYGGSDMIALLDNSTNSLWVPSSPHAIHETMLSFDHEIQQGRRSSPKADHHLGSNVEETGEEFDTSGGFHQPAEKKRRLKAGQVELLEKNFEVENKLEPERKLQLANQLGLEPRQVAIWFQNRRARFKIKQLEKDCDSLKATYDMLKVDYDSLLKERQELQNEVKVLTNKLKQKNTGRANLDPNSPDNQLYSELHDKGNPEIESEKVLKMEWSMKQVEDASSAKSDVLDSDSPNCTDGNHSPFLEGPNCTHILDPNEECNWLIMSKSLLFQPTPTITTYSNDNNYMVKIEDNGTSCNLSLVEDQLFWSLL